MRKKQIPKFNRREIIGLLECDSQQEQVKTSIDTKYLEIPDEQIRRFCERNELSYPLFKYCVKWGIDYYATMNAIKDMRGSNV